MRTAGPEAGSKEAFAVQPVSETGDNEVLRRAAKADEEMVIVRVDDRATPREIGQD
jgi:hypothetical protein